MSIRISIRIDVRINLFMSFHPFFKEFLGKIWKVLAVVQALKNDGRFCMGLRFQHQGLGSPCRVAVLAAGPNSDRLGDGALWLMGRAAGLGLLKGTQRLGPFAIDHVRQSPFLRPGKLPMLFLPCGRLWLRLLSLQHEMPRSISRGL